MDMAIVVLGASQYDGRASKVLAARLDESIATAAEHSAKDVQFFTLGANMPGDRFTEAQVAGTYLVDRGVDESRVHEVPKGNDTVGSLEAVLQEHAVLFGTPSYLITDPLHTVRAKLIAKQLGWSPKVKGARNCPYHFPQKEWWGGLAHEAGGLVVAILTGMFGKKAGEKIRGWLYNVEALIRPRFKTRHGLIRKNSSNSAAASSDNDIE
ncbi:Putative secreted protein [Corynebacterium casei]|uniref:YdcF family protein n=1 Tax=Corynebacterium casei TaxID=160386 RepID=UPI0009D2F73E|nr:YdcF family protein [Corynebacterium casei]SLM94161.1 Putative secreted protein [Corynebacterium casei]